MRANLTCPACQAVLIVTPTDEPTDEPEAPVGEIPPALTMTVCTTCDPFYVAGITLRGGVPNLDRPGTSRPCGMCAGHGSIVTVAA